MKRARNTIAQAVTACVDRGITDSIYHIFLDGRRSLTKALRSNRLTERTFDSMEAAHAVSSARIGFVRRAEIEAGLHNDEADRRTEQFLKELGE